MSMVYQVSTTLYTLTTVGLVDNKYQAVSKVIHHTVQ